jgi:hypothetical protein
MSTRNTFTKTTIYNLTTTSHRRAITTEFLDLSDPLQSLSLGKHILIEGQSHVFTSMCNETLGSVVLR